MFIIAVCVLLLTEQSLCETDPKSLVLWLVKTE